MNLKTIKGRLVSGKIHDVSFVGRIQVEDDSVYICQNIKNGAVCKDQLGYKNSWGVGNGNEGSQSSNGVKDIKLFDIAEYKDFQEGDIIVNKRYDKSATIIFRYKSLAVYELNDAASANWTCNELFDNGWRIQTTEEDLMVEMTLEEVAKLKGISVTKLRIKD